MELACDNWHRRQPSPASYVERNVSRTKRSKSARRIRSDGRLPVECICARSRPLEICCLTQDVE